MAILFKPVSPFRSVDLNGRALPMTEQEILRRNAEAIRALDEVAEMGDEEEQRATLAQSRAWHGSTGSKSDSTMPRSQRM